jgi:channel protein (hemolysin III family)
LLVVTVVVAIASSDLLVLGAGTKIFFSTAVVSEEMGIAFYLGMGWSALIAVPYIRQVPGIIVKWVFIGGFSYSFGIYFLMSHHIHFNHMV